MKEIIKLLILDLVSFVFRVLGWIDGFIEGIKATGRTIKFTWQMAKAGFDNKTIQKQLREEYKPYSWTKSDSEKHKKYVETLKQILSKEDWF